MFDYNSDVEQAEALHKFWQKYKVKILLAVIVLLGSIYGYQRLAATKMQEQTAAADIFYELITNGKSENAETLIKKHHNSAYADLAILWQAKKAVASQKYEQALKDYNTVIKTNRNPAITELAIWYKTHVLVNLKQYKAAHASLEKISNNQDIVNELRGDIYLLENKKSLAYSAYNAGMDASTDPVIKQRIKLKQQSIYRTP